MSPDLALENKELRDTVNALETKLVLERLLIRGLRRSLDQARDRIAALDRGEVLGLEAVTQDLSPFAGRRCERLRRCARCGLLRCLQGRCANVRGR